MDNNTDEPLEGFTRDSVEDFLNLSEKDIKVYALTLTSVLEHLRLNIKESEENDNYRRREAIRSQIAINKIKGLIKTAEENFENILDIPKN
tara:strand:- start:103 stop:375 length:273 start_codon:yes stop_codon:yes gene_type:complete